MLGKLQGMLTRTEGHQPHGADWRDATKEVKTEPPAGLLASVRKLPLDVAAKSAKRANDRVVDAQGNLHRAELALEELRREHAEAVALHEGYVRKHTGILAKALEERERAHEHFLNESREFGALEGCRYVDFKSMNEKKDDDNVPTVRIEHE